MMRIHEHGIGVPVFMFALVDVKWIGEMKNAFEQAVGVSACSCDVRFHF
jgi:hypothetical protein